MSAKKGIGDDTNPSHKVPYASAVSQHLHWQQWFILLCAGQVLFLGLHFFSPKINSDIVNCYLCQRAIRVSDLCWWPCAVV